MYKKIAVVVLCITIILTTGVWASSPTYPEDRGVLLYEENSDKIILEHNIDNKFYPASTTKIMTAILVMENLNLDENVIVGDEITTIPSYSSRAMLEEGEELTVEDLLYALLLPSANDAANVLAVQVANENIRGGTINTRDALSLFSELMNKRAAELGATNTNFVNAHGLHNTNHYSTPRDMLVITKKLLEFSIIKNIIKTTNYHITTNKMSHDWYSTNVFLQQRWDNIPFANRIGDNEYYNTKVDGIKTGSTTPAGKCVIFSAHNDSLDLIGIIYHSTLEELWQEGTDLMNYAFNNYEYINISQKNSNVNKLKINNGKDNDGILSVVTKEDVSILVEKTPEEYIINKVSYIDSIQDDKDGHKILKDIYEDDVIGKSSYYLNDELISQGEVYAGNTMIKKDIFDYIFSWYSIIGFLIILFYLRVLYVRNRRIKNRRKRRHKRR